LPVSGKGWANPNAGAAIKPASIIDIKERFMGRSSGHYLRAIEPQAKRGRQGEVRLSSASATR
jgi:hypothetical protein